MIYNINIDMEVILCDFVSLIWSKMKYTSTKILKQGLLSMEEKEVIKLENDFWLIHFPIMFFASVMGVGGFSLVVNKSMKIFALQEGLGWIFVFCVGVSVCLFGLLVGFYLLEIF